MGFVNFSILTLTLLQILLTNMSCNHGDKPIASDPCDSVVDRSKFSGMSYKLFLGTPVCEAAIALKNSDTAKLSTWLRENKNIVDFQEPQYGTTLLMQAVLLKNYSCVSVLLRGGANPNKKCFPNAGGQSPLMISCSIEDTNLEFLKLLLASGGNPNDTSLEDNNQPSFRASPLLISCSTGSGFEISLSRVQFLVESGANLNFEDPYGHTALGNAIVLERFDIALYLLEHGANYKENIIIHKLDGSELDIISALRESLLPLDSKQYENKMKVVAFLESQGVEYRTSPISPETLNEIKRLYPNDWEEYVKKY